MKDHNRLKTLYNYIAYDCPRRGIFSVMKNPNEYKMPNGWVQVEVERIIIGEDDDCYVEQLLKTERGEWVGEVVVEKKYILPIGLHKSRLVRWIGGDQLSLFSFHPVVNINASI